MVTATAVASRRGAAAATALLALVFLLWGTAGRADAAERGNREDVRVSVGQLVLDPQPGGRHRGTMALTVGYRGPGAHDHVAVDLLEPVGVDYESVTPQGGPCLIRSHDQQRRWHCALTDRPMRTGEQLTFQVEFSSPVGAQTDPRLACCGSVQVAVLADGVEVPDPRPGDNTATVTAVLRGTSGSVDDPRPWQPADDADVSVSAGDLTMTQGPDGTYRGDLTVTVRYAGEVTNDWLDVRVAPPPGTAFAGVTGAGTCWPGGDGSWTCATEDGFVDGQQATLLFHLTADTPPMPGVVGTVHAEARYGQDALPDRTPDDNTTDFIIV